MRIRPALGLILVVVIVALAVRIYQFRNAPRTAPRLIGSVEWTRSLGDPTGYYTSSVLGPDGTLYVANIGGSVYAIDSTGGALWQYHTDPTDSIAGGLVMDERGNLYYGTLSKEYSLDKKGLKRWEASCAGRKDYTDDQGAAIDGNILYAECGNDFVAFDKDHGTQIWQQPGMDRHTAPVLTESGTVVTVRQNRIVASDGNGSTLWTFPPPEYVPITPGPEMVLTAVALRPDGYIVAADVLSNSVVVLDPQGAGKQISIVPKPTPFDSSPAIAPDGSVYVVTRTSALYAFSPDWSSKWAHPLSRVVHVGLHAAPTIGDDGTIYVLSEQTAYAFSPDGTLQWQTSLPGPAGGSPSLGPDGLLYVATLDGQVCALQTASRGLAQKGWPKYQHDSANSGRAAGSSR
jgi:outer membrane protein assembly factor BamB